VCKAAQVTAFGAVEAEGLPVAGKWL